MNKIRAIQELNKREIENGVPPSASWHVDYRDTAFVYFGGLPFELSEGDVITIFSQFGEPTFLKLARDKETGKSRGFGWLKYEDQRSTDLAVDNLGGATIGGRMISVDHARYKPHDDDDPEEGKVGWEDIQKRERAQRAVEGGAADTEGESEEEEPSRPMLKEERELLLLKQNHDDDDPMKAYLIEEKEREVAEALQREKRRSEKHKREHKHRHRHERSHRSRRDDSDEEDRHRRRRKERDGDDLEKKRSRRDDTPVLDEREDEGDDSRRSRRRDDSRDRDSRRDRDRDDRDRRRDQDKERRRHGREDDDDYSHRRHRDLDDRDRRHRRRSRSRSP